MLVRYFSIAYGVLFLLIGVAGFIPGVVAPEATGGSESPFSGRLLGLFPVNALHSLVHIAFGVWGLVASRSLGQGRLYARVVAVAYAVLAVMGLIPVLNTTFGLIPLYSHDVWLHALLAAVAAYVGWSARAGAGAPATG